MTWTWLQWYLLSSVALLNLLQTPNQYYFSLKAKRNASVASQIYSREAVHTRSGYGGLH